MVLTMTHETNSIDQIYRAARFALADRLQVSHGRSKTVLKSFDPVFGFKPMICGLCLYLQKSSKAFSARRDMCMSCSMRGDSPLWVNVSGQAIALWRGSMFVSQRELAAASGLHQPAVARLERAARMNGATAAKVATGFVRLSLAGKDLGTVVREWPLFPLLVDPTMLALMSGDAEILGDLGQPERHERVSEERGSDVVGPPDEGSGTRGAEAQPR